jgi:hypothetical protein
MRAVDKARSLYCGVPIGKQDGGEEGYEESR